MADELKPENKALVESVLGYGTARTYNRHEIDRLIDAARAQGPSEAAADPVDLFLAEVRAELVRARAKFPGDRIMTIALAEEFGELCKAILDEPAANVRKEAVQTAVMAARVVLDGDGSVAEWRTLKGLDPLAAFCVSHPGQRAVTNLDGDNLCLDCANAWVKAEGDHQAYLEQEGGDHG